MKQEREIQIFITLALFCGVLAAGLGFIALVGWVLRLPLLTSFSLRLIPMAPSTALLFILLGGAVSIYALSPQNHVVKRMGLVIGSMVTFVSLFLLILSSLGIYLAVEYLGIPISGTLNGIPTGHMSPMTALSFLLASLSFLTLLYYSYSHPRWVMVAIGLASLLTLVNYIFILAYFIGLPMFYHGNTIPPALPTCWAFLSIGISLLTVARAQVRVNRKVNEPISNRVPYSIILVFVVLAISIITVGYLYYRNYKLQYRTQVELQLSAISELKVSGLASWRNEQMGDAEVLYHNPASSALVQRFFDNPEDTQTQAEIQTWLESYHSYGQYDRVRLLDAQGKTRLSAPAGLPPVSKAVTQLIPEVMQTGQITIVDFYQNDYDHGIYLSVLIPIEGTAKKIIGIVVLRIDPRIYLFPYIDQWPTPSTSAETLLVRRDGNDVLFLNALRFDPNAAMTLRFPLTETELPAARAVLGQTGIFEGVDYRGEPVLADIHKVADSPWFLISKMDTTEVYAPLTARLWQSVIFFGALIFASGAGLVVVWRQQRVRYYRSQVDAAVALRESEERYRSLYENATIGIYRTTPDGQILLANASLVKMLGYASFKELSTRNLEKNGYEPPYPRTRFLDLMEKDGEVKGLESVWKRRDGSPLFVRESARAIRNLQGKIAFFDGTVEDIDERRRAEIVRQALLEIMEGSSTSEELSGFIRLAHHAIGRVIFAENFFIVLYNRETGLFEEIYSEDKYDPIPTPYEMGKSVSAYVFHTQQPLLLTQEHFDELKEKGEVELIGTNSPSWLGVPLKVLGETIGVMVVQDYENANRYSEDDMEMLSSIAGQVALVINRKRIEEALRVSEARYRHTLDAMLEGCQIIGFDWRYIYLNDIADKHNRRSKEELLGKKYMNIWPGVESTEVFNVMRRCMEDRLSKSMENEFIFPEGGKGWFDLRIYPVPEGIVVLSIDITERKQAEKQLTEYSERLEETVEARTHELRQAQDQLVRQERLATLGQLAGSIGHELRNPLGVISNAIYFLKMAQPNAKKTVKEYLDIIENEIRTSDKIVTDLLDFTRHKSLDQEEVAVSELVSQTLERFPTPPKVELKLDFPKDLPHVYVDPQHVVQILGNLTVNACQSMENEGELTISADIQSDMIVIAVKDTGSGILPENMGKLFEPLFTTKTKGIGLGLAVSRKLAEANGGRIEVQSEPGNGSTFSLYLPINPAK